MLKITSLFFIIIQVTISSCFAQDTIPVWKQQTVITWVKPNTNYHVYFCIDKYNNSFTLIDFNDSLSLGDSLFVNGNKKKLSAMLIKYNNDGNVCWMYPMVNKTDIWSISIAADNKGGCYITGTYKGNFPISPTLTLDSTQTMGRSFIANFNSNGQLAWAKGFANAAPLLLSTSRNGDVYVKRGNSFGGTYQLGDSIMSNTNKETIAKFDATGKFYWARTITPSGGFMIDSFDNIIIFNAFNSKVTVDTLQLVPKIAGRADMFIAKYNPSFEIQWVKHFENVATANTLFIDERNVTSDKLGNIYMGNSFRDSLTILGHTYYSPQFRKIFFLKINPEGQIVWVKVPDGFQPYDEGVSAICFTSSNKLKGKIKITNATNFNGHSLPGISSEGVAFIEMDTSGLVSHLRPLITPNYWFRAGSGNSYFQCSPLPAGDSIKVQGKFYKSIKPYDLFLIKYDTSFYSTIPAHHTNIIKSSLYPNPATSECFISTQNDYIQSLQLYNSLGTLILDHKNLHEPIFRLDVGSIPKGVYFIRISSCSGKFGIQKLIVN